MKKNEKRAQSVNKNIKEKEPREIKGGDSAGKNNFEQVKEFQKGTDMISSLIHEYLLKREYSRTIDAFQEEVNMKFRTKSYYNSKFFELGEANLMKFFTNGNKSEFFKLWNRIIPAHIKLKETALEKLDFFIQIYFAIYPLLPCCIGDNKNIKDAQLKEIKTNMNEFKLYLESKEVEMSKTTEYLAYYALPYVQNPRDHPTYKQLFTNEWTKELKEKIKACLKSYIPTSKYPMMYDIVSSHVKDPRKIEVIQNFLENLCVDGNERNEPDSNSNSHLLEEYNKLKQREENTKITFIESQKTWTNLSLSILSISFELVALFKKAASVSNGVDGAYVEKLNKKLNKYQAFLTKNAEELEKNKNSSAILREKDYMEELESNEKINSSKNKSQSDQGKEKEKDMQGNNNQIIQVNPNNISNNSQLNQINQSIHIDYDPTFLIDMRAVRADMAKVNAFGLNSAKHSENINFILREIRLRISRRKYIKLKQLTLHSIIYHDLLGIRSKHVKFFVDLLNKEATVLETLKLMNVITNDNRGRTYLLSKPSLIDEIVKIMVKEETDTEIRQNCLGIIQKFTLRSEPQKRLIELDVIMWITNVFIFEGPNISDYTLEYGLALLMNLSLRVSGRDKCELVSEKLLKIMINSMNNESVQVRTCINGTLYSLLKRKKIKEEAIALGLEKILNKQLENPNEQMKKQIMYILDELKVDTETEENLDEDFEDDNFGDEEEEIADDEYYEEESITNEMILLHYQNLGEYIIKNAAENKEEINRITEFIGGNANIGGNISNVNNIVNLNRNNTSNNSIRRDELDRPLRRPTTPMTNLSSTSNSQLFNPERRSFQSKLQPNVAKPQDSLIPNENITDQKEMKNDQKEPSDTTDFAQAFEKKDKLSRTPPANFSKI